MLSVPGADCWGNPDRIWPTGNPWTREKADLADLVSDWQSMLEGEDFGKQVKKAFASIAEYLMSWEPGKNLFGKSKTMMKLAFDGLGAMHHGEWEFKFGNTKGMIQPSAEFGHKLERVLRYCIAWELSEACPHAGDSRAAGRVRKTVRLQGAPAGRLMFGDLPVLLAPVAGGVAWW